LFLIFINDLEIDLVNSVFKFADDTKVLGRVSSSSERDQLQQDLQQMMNWSDAIVMANAIQQLQMQSYAPWP